jgi:hypothetical protein
MELRCLLENKKIKSLNELTDEELMNQLDDSESNEIDSVKNVKIIQDPILDFIQQFNLQAGKYPVPARALAILYRKTTNDKFVRDQIFINKIRQFFRVVQNMVYVNKSVFHFHAQIEILLNKKRKIRLTTEAVSRNLLEFLEGSGIKKGPIAVPNFIIYHIYKDFCFRKNRTPVTKNNFYIFADKTWDKTITQYGESYLVNNKGDLYDVKQYKKIQKIYQKTKKDSKKRSKKESN